MGRMLLFRIGAQEYGLELEALQEVADDPPWHAVPGAGTRLLVGAVNRNGRILPVIDLPKLFGLEQAPRDQRLMVLASRFHGLALVVSGIGRIVPFETEKLQLPLGEEDNGLVTATVEIDNRQVRLLDAAAVVERLDRLIAA